MTSVSFSYFVYLPKLSVLRVSSESILNNRKRVQRPGEAKITGEPSMRGEVRGGEASPSTGAKGGDGRRGPTATTEGLFHLKRWDPVKAWGGGTSREEETKAGGYDIKQQWDLVGGREP